MILRRQTLILSNLGFLCVCPSNADIIPVTSCNVTPYTGEDTLIKGAKLDFPVESIRICNADQGGSRTEFAIGYTEITKGGVCHFYEVEIGQKTIPTRMELMTLADAKCPSQNSDAYSGVSGIDEATFIEIMNFLDKIYGNKLNNNLLSDEARLSADFLQFRAGLGRGDHFKVQYISLQDSLVWMYSDYSIVLISNREPSSLYIIAARRYIFGKIKVLSFSRGVM